MCGRLDQNDIARLIGDFAWADEIFNRNEAPGSFNVAPGTYRPVLHVDEADLFVRDMHWGYRSSWAEASGQIPVAINTRLEKITSRYWSGLLKRGRAILPADGWYEWTGEKGSKQPWHIHRGDGAPIYMAALANVAPANEFKASNGFTIVTADAQGGMVDVHDRRPVVLSAKDAALWLDPDLPPEQAEQLLRSVALGPASFDWFMVDRTVGKAWLPIVGPGAMNGHQVSGSRACTPSGSAHFISRSGSSTAWGSRDARPSRHTRRVIRPRSVCYCSAQRSLILPA